MHLTQWMKAKRPCIAYAGVLLLMACGGGTELTATLSGAAVRPKSLATALSGAAEKPTSTPSMGSGRVEVTMDGNKLQILGSFRDLSSNVTAAHIHGPADENSTANVFCTLQAPAAVSGSLSAGTGAGVCSSRTLSDANVQDFMSGRMYVNIHTQAYPAGEIRGQLRVRPPSDASGEVEVTVVDGKKLKIFGSFNGLSSRAASAAIHGPADEESTAGVFCTLDIPGDTSGTFHEGQSPGTCGTIELSAVDVANFEGGRMYVSIRTEEWSNGEVRGQLK